MVYPDLAERCKQWVEEYAGVRGGNEDSSVSVSSDRQNGVYQRAVIHPPVYNPIIVEDRTNRETTPSRNNQSNQNNPIYISPNSHYRSNATRQRRKGQKVISFQLVLVSILQPSLSIHLV